MDFMKILSGGFGRMAKASEDEAMSKYGDAYSKAGGLKKAAMRIAKSPFESIPGDLGSEMDLERFVSLRPGAPQSADPLQLYRSLYGSYGGKKMRGLLFD